MKARVKLVNVMTALDKAMNDDDDAEGDADVTTARRAVGGRWTEAKAKRSVPDPLNGQPFIFHPDTSADDVQPFVDSLAAVPKSGLHNPYKNPER